MPQEKVYAVDFSQGNLVPSIDTNGWGAMMVGDSGPGASPVSTGDPQGLNMSITAAGIPAAIGAYVVFSNGMLDLATRLVMQVEFDRPNAIAPQPPAAGAPEPWAVALNLKLDDEDFVAGEPMVPVTCQFVPDGVRLNTPGDLEGHPPTMLITPLAYEPLSPVRYQLEHHFCGASADRGYTIGYGTLSVGPPVKKNDQRVYSSAGLTPGLPQAGVGALGVTIVTGRGSGHISARLRSFTVSVWS